MSTKRDAVVADFNRSVIPTIVCVNKAKTPLGVKFDDLIPALRRDWSEAEKRARSTGT
jgi:hypothetical protein